MVLGRTASKYSFDHSRLWRRRCCRNLSQDEVRHQSWLITAINIITAVLAMPWFLEIRRWTFVRSNRWCVQFSNRWPTPCAATYNETSNGSPCRLRSSMTFSLWASVLEQSVCSLCVCVCITLPAWFCQGTCTCHLLTRALSSWWLLHIWWLWDGNEVVFQAEMD